jgi:hypothetical protein
MPLSDIVNVTISTTDAIVSRPGFGVPLILGVNMTWTNRVRYYSDLVTMAADGMTASTPEYKAAQAMFAQNPAPTRIAVGRLSVKPTLQWKLTPSTALAQVIQTVGVNVNGAPVLTAPTDATPTQAEVVALLVTALNGQAGLTATNQATFCQLAGAAGAWADISPTDLNKCSLAVVSTSDPTMSSELDAIRLESDDWYAVHNPWASPSIITAIAAWAETNEKLYLQASADTDIINVADAGASDIAHNMKAATRARTAVIYHAAPGEFFDAALLGKCLPLTPGSETWKFKTLSGVTADALSGTQLTNLRAKNCGYYYTISGLNISAEGQVAAGDWIDVVRGRDWLKANIQADVFAALAGAQKIPYTDAGVAVLEGAIRGRLREAVLNGFLSDSPAPTVTVPKVATVAAASRQARTLPNVLFSGIIAGAIHSLTIQGTVKV